MQQLGDFFIDSMNAQAEVRVDIRSFPYLADHGFLDMLVLPGSSYIDMALCMDQQLSNRVPSVVRNVVFEHPVILSTEGTVVKVEVIDHNNNRVEYKFYEAKAENEKALSSGRRHAARLEIDRNLLPLSRGAKQAPPVQRFQFERQAQLDRETFYKKLHENGNNYGPSFQNISSIWQIGSEWFGKLTFGSRAQLNESHVLHPTVIDSVTQLLANFFLEEGKPFVLRSIDRVEILDVNLPNTLFAHATLLQSDSSRNSFVGNVRACDQSGNTYFECTGVALSLLDPAEPVETDKRTFAIASNFTAEPLADSLNFWADYFQWTIRLEFAPYNQLFQQLLDTRSAFQKKNNDIGIVLLNLEEWIGMDQADAIIPVRTENASRSFDNHLTYRLPNGLEICHLNKYETEYLYKEIFEDKCYLKHGIRLQDGDTVVDIGANIGLFSLFVMSHCKDARIFAFEPAPMIYEILKTNCEAYGANVRTVNAGVSKNSEAAMLTFYEMSSVFSGFHADETEDRKTIRSIVRTMLENETQLQQEDLETYVDEFVAERLSARTHKCEMTSVSDIIRDNGLDKIDLLKIDAEKSELEIIKGISESDWPKIAQLVIEIHDSAGAVMQRIEDLLVEKGFRCVVAQEKLLKQSGLYNLYATRHQFQEPIRHASSLQRNVKDFCDAVRLFMNQAPAPLVVCVCPPTPNTLADAQLHKELNDAERQLRSAVSEMPNVYTISSTLPLQRYSLIDYYDPHSHVLGHIPYTTDWYAAVGTAIFRTIFNLTRTQLKAIVLDCDNTLWEGVCAEVGPLGVDVSPPYRALQQFMVDQMNAGKLLCLCSKNNEADVLCVFDERSDLSIKREHLVSWRINWKSKSENIKSLAKELNLGLDSFIFIDDNPVDCADVRINAPDVLTLQVPPNSSLIPPFLEHVWSFDSISFTNEDRNRTRMYQENVKRQRFQAQTISLKDFINGLQLRIEMAAASDEDLARASQLTFRTNQFNFTTIRRHENEIRDLLRTERFKCHVVHVADRFGDYGLVGVVLYEILLDRFKVDTFLLSCRVLGRGVEHAVLSRLGQLALKQNKRFVELTCVPTEKNSPAMNFIESVGPQFGNTENTSWTLPADYLAALKYDPEEMVQKQTDLPDTIIGEFSRRTSQSDAPGLSGRVQYIADRLSDIADLRTAIEEYRLRQQPAADEEDSPKSSSIQSTLVDIWKAVLGRTRIKLHDNFFEVGGSSLKAVQVLAMIKKELKQDLSIVSLFEYPTVALLAERLSGFSSEPRINRSTSEAVLRGQKRLTNLKARRVN